MTSSFEFHKSRRLLKTAEFDRVFARRRSAGDGAIVLYGAENGLAHARLGLVVSRKCGNAVARNFWKRRLREAFRLVQNELPGGIDLVVVPRAGAKPSVAGLARSIRLLTAKLAPRLKDPPAESPL